MEKLRIRALIPAYSLSPANISNLINRLPEEAGIPLVVYNDVPDSNTLIRLRELEITGKIQTLILPFQVGKAEAVRRGLVELLKDENIDAIVQVDGRQKQPPEDVSVLIEHLKNSNVDMVIANRYAYQNLESDPHRKIASSVFSGIIRHFTGIDIPDAVCGTRIYRVKLAKAFLRLRSFGYGLEAEQLVIASLAHASVSYAPIHSAPQENYTPAEKIEDNLMVFLAYANELAIDYSAKATLCYIQSQIKQRRAFKCDLTGIGIDKQIIGEPVVLPNGFGYTLSSAV
jgi:hypothetical protein